MTDLDKIKPSKWFTELFGEKCSEPLPNVANHAQKVLEGRCPELAGLRGVHVTGSTVWPLAYRRCSTLSDLDIMITGNFWQRWSRRRRVVKLLGLLYLRNTLRYASAGQTGRKYHSSRGLVDIWYAPRGVQHAMLTYPESSHAHCRVAVDCETGAVVIMPNTAALPVGYPPGATLP